MEARWQTERDDDIGRRAGENETTTGGGWQGVKDRPGVGEDQTSRRATGWSLPALLRVSSFSSAAAYQECLALSASLFFSLLGIALAPAARLSPAVLLALILFIFPRSCSSTMWFDDLRSRRSSLRLLPYGRARNRPRCLAKLFDGKLHRRPADLPFRNRLRRSRQISCTLVIGRLYVEILDLYILFKYVKIIPIYAVIFRHFPLLNFEIVRSSVLLSFDSKCTEIAEISMVCK